MISLGSWEEEEGEYNRNLVIVLGGWNLRESSKPSQVS